VTIEILLVLCIVAQRALRFLEERHHREEQAAWRLERASLLQRIQAPELAVIEHQTAAPAANPSAVSMHDDADFWKAQEALARIETMEREGP
jgi:hypothetical protein